MSEGRKPPKIRAAYVVKITASEDPELSEECERLIAEWLTRPAEGAKTGADDPIC